MAPTLAQRQAALVAALTGNGPVPEGFDAARVRAAAEALAAKRARACLQAWPGLRALLGADFRAHFDAYAVGSSIPEAGGPLADGRRFVRELAATLPLTDDVALQALAVDQRWRSVRSGLVPRRWPRLGVARLHGARRLVIAFGGAELRLPFPRSGR